MKTTSPTTSTKRSCQPPSVLLETFITEAATNDPLAVLLTMSFLSSFVARRADENIPDARPAVCFFRRESTDGVRRPSPPLNESRLSRPASSSPAPGVLKLDMPEADMPRDERTSSAAVAARS
eukprot:scaffold12365_cov96-Phaeocystis_antarctica.AAC.2